MEQSTLTGNNAPHPHSGPGPDSHRPGKLRGWGVGGRAGDGDRDGQLRVGPREGTWRGLPIAKGSPGSWQPPGGVFRANRAALQTSSHCARTSCAPTAAHPGAPPALGGRRAGRGPPISAGGDGVGRKQAPACKLSEAVAVGELRGEFPRCLASPLRLGSRGGWTWGGAGRGQLGMYRAGSTSLNRPTNIGAHN